jgi:hypothetical protein
MPEAVRLDQVKAEEGMSQMVSVILKNLGLGAGGVDGIFPQYSQDQTKRVLEQWFGTRVEGAFSISAMFRPSMSGPHRNLVLGTTWNITAELEVGAPETLRKGGRAIYVSRVIAVSGEMEEAGEHWKMQEQSGNLLRASKEFFGQEAEVEVPMNTEAEDVVTVIAGRDEGELGAWAKVMSGAVGPGDVSEMLRVAFYKAGLPVECVDTACSVTPLNINRLEKLMDEELGGDGEDSLGSYPDLTEGRASHLNCGPHTIASRYMVRLTDDNEAAKWAYKLLDIEIKIEMGGVETWDC